MEFLPKDFEQLHHSHIKEHFEEDNISSYYFYCAGHDIMFIKKARNCYKICCSVTCGFDYIYHESTFDVIFMHKDLSAVIDMYKFFLKFLIQRIK